MPAKRGRKSFADIQQNLVAANFGARPDPPADLTKRQKEIWNETVRGESPEWFKTPALQMMLASYCGYVENIEAIGVAIKKIGNRWQTDQDVMKQWSALVKLRQRESSAMALMATKLRITNQSRWNRDAAKTQAKNAATGPTPWERKGAA